MSFEDILSGMGIDGTRAGQPGAAGRLRRRHRPTKPPPS